jgi:eukaryotic-like serine/threonine-protein kinase
MREGSRHEKVSVESLVARVADEFLERQKNGERPDIEEYAARHPEAAELLRKVLAALELIGRSQLGGSGLPAMLTEPAGTLGDFLIGREVGRGGMGVVYEAEQISLRRRVALKVLPFAATMDARHLQRFHNEARAAACLHHPHIVPVYAVGCERSVHYYAMQFIDGQSLEGFLRKLHQPTTDSDQPEPISAASDTATAVDSRAKAKTQPLPRDAVHFRQVAEWGIAVAEALEHAHSLGIVHRDIKPGNLLLDAAGRLWVTDFGLARTVNDTGLTLTGDVMGTLRYMSPEQALAKHGLVDHRTDIYSLGVTLYELLTLRPAIDGLDREELLNKVAFEEPPGARQRNAAIPVELETIVRKAMSKEPVERYATAKEVADDLRRFLDDKPIRARPPTIWERLVKWTRRHKTLMGAAAAVLFLAVGGLAIGSFLIWQEQKQTKAALKEASEQRRAAQENAAKAESQRQRAMANLDQALNAIIDLAQQLDREDWADLPRFREIRRALIQQIQHHYERFIKEESADRAVRFEMARAYISLGILHEMQGNLEEAEQTRRKAIALLEALRVDYPKDLVYRKQLGHSHAAMAWQLEDKGMIGQAVDEYRKALQAFEEAMRLAPDDPSPPNNMAWTLVVSNLPELRNPLRAIELAKKATQMAPRRRAVWNTLGVAYYRAGDWSAAVTALEKSEQLSNDINAGNEFFLAMAHWRRGHKQQARRCYDNAIQWMDENKPNDKELRRWCNEAAALLGIGEQPRKKRDHAPEGLGSARTLGSHAGAHGQE